MNRKILKISLIILILGVIGCATMRKNTAYYIYSNFWSNQLCKAVIVDYDAGELNDDDMKIIAYHMRLRRHDLIEQGNESGYILDDISNSGHILSYFVYTFYTRDNYNLQRMIVKKDKAIVKITTTKICF